MLRIRSWLTLAALLSLCTPLVRAQTPLRIATFNAEILKAPGSRAGSLSKYRWDVAREAQFERVAAVIEAINPDILNLVEVTSQDSVDLLIKILHEKGLTRYQGYHVENNDSFTSMDVALISKYPPDEIKGQPIRTMWSENDDPTWRETYRVVGRSGRASNRNGGISRNAVYLITIDDTKLGFLGLHLKSNPSDEAANAMRSAQAKISQRIVRQEITGRGYLPIVLGDLNDYDPDVPDRDDERDTLTTVVKDIKDFDRQQEGDELVNIAKLIPRQADRYTSFWDRNENGARDPYDVFTMLDHILLPQELMPMVTRAFIFHSVDLETSDHRAVVVDLLLPEKK
ncbi:MAG: endonuclease/exonuclease/phosphatase family protein [Bythopirellula sp.]